MLGDRHFVGKAGGGGDQSTNSEVVVKRDADWFGCVGDGN